MNILTEQQVGNAFRELRRIRGLSLEDVAITAKTHRNTVWRLECGSVPNLRIQSAIAEALEMPLSRIIRHAEKMLASPRKVTASPERVNPSQRAM